MSWSLLAFVNLHGYEWSHVTPFRHTAWFLAFMVTAYSVLGGTAHLICVGCDRSEIRLGSCCCDDGENSPKDQGSDRDCDPDSPQSINRSSCCAELVFRLEETPVEKNTIEPAPVVIVYNSQLLELETGVVPPATGNYSHHPSDSGPPLWFARTVRLLI